MAVANQQTGIIGYGAYVPRYRIAAREIARVWNAQGGVPVEQKSVAGPDEDTITMTIEAGRNALRRALLHGADLGTVWVGSESHPYAVKPSGTLVAEALGCTPAIHAADWEFACKAGTEALTAAMGMVASGLVRYALAAGADTAQGRPGDALEYTAASGAAALIVGPGSEALATIDATVSYVTDTPDFFRRADRQYPVHGNRFTGEPAYFMHIKEAGKQLLRETGAEPGDFRYLVVHQPNAKFPQIAAKHSGSVPNRSLQVCFRRASATPIRLRRCLACAPRWTLPSRRPHHGGVIWLGRWRRWLCTDRHRSLGRCPDGHPLPRHIWIANNRSIMRPMPVGAANW